MKKILLLFLLSITTLAQKTSLDVAGMNIKLGMTKDNLLNQLSPECNLQPTDDNKGFFITKNDKPYGIVIFTNNKISTISKYLMRNSGTDIFEIISTFYEGLNKEIDEDKFVKTITYLSAQTEPDKKNKSISISKGNWRVTISVMKTSEGFTYIIIDESIRQVY